MNRDKQIEEMAFEMTQYKETVCDRIEHNNCLLKFHTNAFINCHFCKLAEHLITEKGYRKASDIVGEIIKDLVDFADDNEKQMLVNGHSVWFINADDVTEFITELKKKYTEEGK